MNEQGGGSALESFFVELGFRTNVEGSSIFIVALNKVIASIGVFATALTGGAIALAGLGIAAGERLASIYELGEATGIAATDLYALNTVMQDTGMSFNAAEESVGSFAKMFGQASAGIGRGKMLFEHLGLSAKDASGHTKSMTDMLGDVAEKMKGQTAPERYALATRLGLGPEFIRALKDGRANFKALQDEAAKKVLFSEDTFKQAWQMQMSIKAVFRAVVGLSIGIGSLLIPYVDQVALAVTDFIKASTPAKDSPIVWVITTLASFLGGVITHIIELGTGIMNVLTWFGKFTVLMATFKVIVAGVASYFLGMFIQRAVVGIYGFVAAMGSAIYAMFSFQSATAILTPIFTLVGALAGAAYLLWDDWTVFQKGGDSMWGRWLRDSPALRKLLDDLGKFFTWLRDNGPQILSNVVDWIGRMWTEYGDMLLDGLKSIGTWFVNAFSYIGGHWKEIVGWIEAIGVALAAINLISFGPLGIAIAAIAASIALVNASLADLNAQTLDAWWNGPTTAKFGGDENVVDQPYVGSNLWNQQNGYAGNNTNSVMADNSTNTVNVNVITNDKAVATAAVDQANQETFKGAKTVQRNAGSKAKT